MQIPVRLSAALAQTGGQTRLSLTLAEGATVSDAIQSIAHQFPALESKLPLVIPFVAGQQVGRSAQLQPKQELALLLPAAGGKGDRMTG